ncbi:MAG TPA: VanW family protein [Aggregatilineaceae bacterium]|nr:VanW family protein [Aggregatilineaceae bacterium]
MSAPNVPYPARGSYAPRVNPWALRLPLLFITGLILLFFLLIILIAGYQFLHEDEIYPGVSTVCGLNLAGMTRQEAITALSQQVDQVGCNSQAIETATFEFRYQGEDGQWNSWEYSAADLGLQLNIEATVDEAYKAGRGGNRLENFLEQLDVRQTGYRVSPVLVYDQSDAERILSEIANTYINQPVLNASLSLVNNQAIAMPAQVGHTLDVPAALSVLRQEITSLNSHSVITLEPYQTQPKILDASSAADQINLALSAPVQFYIAEGEGPDQGPWSVPVDKLAKMVSNELVTAADGTAQYQVRLNLDEARTFLDNLSPDLTVQPVNARFTFNDDTSQLEVIENSVNGRALDIDTTLAQFEDAIFSSDPAQRRVKLIFINVPAQIPDTATASQLGITELVIQKTTYYYGSTAARRNNIEVAASRFHGIVIAPYGEFSFNEWLGDVSPETGYEAGLIIVNNQTIPGVGGGVCQVATTAFQAAFYGGYPINERLEHAYRVSYYEQGEGAGMDATVYSPIVDLRFTNDTPYYLLIETYVNLNNSTITFKFYSTSLDRRVEKEGPYIKNQTSPPPPVYRANANLRSGQINQVDYAVSGADVYVYRTVYEGDRVIIDHEEFHSHYVSWANQYEVAPGDPRING